MLFEGGGSIHSTVDSEELTQHHGIQAKPKTSARPMANRTHPKTDNDPPQGCLGVTPFEDGLREQLDEWTAIVARLRAKVESEHGDTRIKPMTEIEELAAHQTRAETYL